MALLDDKTICVVRRLIGEHRAGELADFLITASTLGAAAELACATLEWERVGEVAGVQVAERWAAGNDRIARALACVRGAQLAEADRYAAPMSEMASVTSDAGELPFRCERFKRSLVTHGGYTAPLASALSGALGEMIDNVLRHSTEVEGAAATSLAAFEVKGPEFEFVVADDGRGALASLGSIPAWAGLTSARSALDAIVTTGATRRSGTARGGGYRDLFASLVDLAGELRLRSDDAAVTLDGRGDPSRRLKVHQSVPKLGGFQVTVRGRR